MGGGCEEQRRQEVAEVVAVVEGVGGERIHLYLLHINKPRLDQMSN